MALSNSLNTNEIKNASAAEVEFSRLETGPGSRTTFAQVNESPSKPHRLSISHQEVGVGIKSRRRSVIRFDKSVVSDVDTTVVVPVSAYVVVDIPKGALNTTTEISNVIAELMSFLATTGAGTTVLFDCSGTGAAVLRDASL